MISVTTQGELLVRLDQAPLKLRELVVAKLAAAINAAYAKGILQFSAGKYSATSEVEHGVEVQGSLAIGYIEPVTVKAQVQEFGGKGFYEILPSKARVLRFIGSKDGAVVFTKYVLHPPLEGKHYIQQALLDAIPDLEASFAEMLPEVFR